MQNVGADADEDAEEADVVFAGQGNGLAAVVSTFASLHVVGVDGITMPTASVLDTTYLTGAFANKAYTVRQDGAIRHMRICGMSHALNGSEVVVVRQVGDRSHIARSIAAVRASLRNVTERKAYDLELKILRLRARLAKAVVF